MSRAGQEAPKTIRPLSRFITTHDETGNARFSNDLSEDMPVQTLANGDYTFSLAYISENFPVRFGHDEDIKVYKKCLDTSLGLAISSGTVCRVVDMSPGLRCAMHRTVSLDYGVVLEGEVELILDSGETRILKRGDVAVQRGTNHAWKNVTPDVVVAGKKVGAWARMLYVLVAAEKVDIKGMGRLDEVVVGLDVQSST